MPEDSIILYEPETMEYARRRIAIALGVSEELLKDFEEELKPKSRLLTRFQILKKDCYV